MEYCRDCISDKTMGIAVDGHSHCGHHTSLYVTIRHHASDVDGLETQLTQDIPSSQSHTLPFYRTCGVTLLGHPDSPRPHDH